MPEGLACLSGKDVGFFFFSSFFFSSSLLSRAVDACECFIVLELRKFEVSGVRWIVN